MCQNLLDVFFTVFACMYYRVVFDIIDTIIVALLLFLAIVWNGDIDIWRSNELTLDYFAYFHVTYKDPLKHICGWRKIIDVEEARPTDDVIYVVVGQTWVGKTIDRVHDKCALGIRVELCDESAINVRHQPLSFDVHSDTIWHCKRRVRA